MDDDVGLLDGTQARDGEQVRIARAAADQDDLAGSQFLLHC